MQLPIAKAAYKRGEGPGVSLVNLFYEKDERNLATGMALMQRPSLVAFATVATAGFRGIFRQEGVLAGVVIAVVGTKAYKITAAGVVTTLGDIPGAGFVSMAGNATRVYIANGTAAYSTDGATVSAVAFPDGAGCKFVAYINGYVLFVRSASQRYYWIAPGSTTIGALDYLAAEGLPDELEAIAVIADQVYLLGKATLEVADPTGDANTPFLRSGGQFFQQGCVNGATVAQVLGGLNFVGVDRGTGALAVLRVTDAPIRISDPYVDQCLRKADLTKLRAWTFGIDGHAFYVLTTGNETLVCDVAGGNVWTTFKSFGLDYWRAHMGCNLGDGRILAGDALTGTLWRLDNDALLDGSDPVERIWSARIQRPVAERCTNVILDADSAGGDIDADPIAQMRISKDRGRTWGTWNDAYLGRAGDFEQRAIFKPRTLVREAEFEFRVTDPVRLTVRGAEYNGALRR